MRIALVRCVSLPEADPDEVPTAQALREAGHIVEVPGWDDPTVDWGLFDVCILRATWNYARQVRAFEDWLTGVEGQTRLWNPASVVRENLHKRYLLEFEAKGVPVIPTVLVPMGQACDLAAVVHERGWAEVVVKPAISAGSWRTKKFASDQLEQAQQFADEIGRDGDLLLQEMRIEFAEPGERSLIWIDGEVTHSIIKRPRFAGEEESVTPGGPITPEQNEFVDRVLECATKPLLYARVDVIPTRQGLMLSELELIEPSLFFEHGPKGLDRFVRAVGRLA